MMRALLMSLLTCFFAILSCAEQTPGTEKGVPPTYELYSWRDSKGVWNFSLLYNTNRQKTVKEVFSKKSALRGVNQLKQKLATLPVSSTVVWFDRLTLGGVRVKGSESLEYPPREIIDEVRHYAEEHHIAISGPERVYP